MGVETSSRDPQMTSLLGVIGPELGGVEVEGAFSRCSQVMMLSMSIDPELWEMGVETSSRCSQVTLLSVLIDPGLWEMGVEMAIGSSLSWFVYLNLECLANCLVSKVELALVICIVMV